LAIWVSVIPEGLAPGALVVFVGGAWSGVGAPAVSGVVIAPPVVAPLGAVLGAALLCGAPVAGVFSPCGVAALGGDACDWAPLAAPVCAIAVQARADAARSVAVRVMFLMVISPLLWSEAAPARE
jgi:hypothetical protein